MKSEVYLLRANRMLRGQGTMVLWDLVPGTLSGSQFSLREDQNLDSEFSKYPMCPASCGVVSLAGRAPLILYPSPSCCFQLWDPRSEPGETSHRPRTQQGPRANHQCDDHRGPLAHQVMIGVWGWDGDLGALIIPLRGRQGLRLLSASLGSPRHVCTTWGSLEKTRSMKSTNKAEGLWRHCCVEDPEGPAQKRRLSQGQSSSLTPSPSWSAPEDSWGIL